MKIPPPPGLAVVVVLVLLAALTGGCVVALVLRGAPGYAAAVGAGGWVAMVALWALPLRRSGTVGALQGGEEERVARLPAVPPAPQALSHRRVGVREARPGEVPPAYLAAVMRGAQATHAALKARSRPH